VLVNRAGETTRAYTLLGLIGLGVISVCAVFLPDEPIDRSVAPPFTLRSFLRGFWIDLRQYPDVGWAWLTRFLVYLSYSVATGYLFYYLQDIVHVPDPTKGVTIFQSIIVGTNVLAAIASGTLSDRLQRRKGFMMASSFLLGAAVLLLGLFPTWTIVLVVAGMVGTGFGIYLGVDLAVITQVLPSSRDHGRDLGIMTLANVLPQVMGPLIAAWAILTFHSYLALFVVAMLLAVIGGVLVTRIKSVR
jgi:MFS family permease